MKDAKRTIQTRYFDLLNGNVIIPKELFPVPVRPATDYTVPVYDNIPTNATYPYIKLQEWTEVDFSTKTSFGSELTFTVQIVDRYTQAVTRSPMYYVLSRLKEIIRARPVPFGDGEFNVISSVVDNETTFRQMTDTYVYLYNNVRFRHLVEELPFNVFDETFDTTFQ